MPCRRTSSKKVPWPWTSRLSSLRGIDCPTKPFSSVLPGSVTVVVIPCLPVATTASTMFT